jgi:hypothetical protein
MDKVISVFAMGDAMDIWHGAEKKAIRKKGNTKCVVSLHLSDLAARVWRNWIKSEQLKNHHSKRIEISRNTRRLRRNSPGGVRDFEDVSREKSLDVVGRYAYCY